MDKGIALIQKLGYEKSAFIARWHLIGGDHLVRQYRGIGRAKELHRVEPLKLQDSPSGLPRTFSIGHTVEATRYSCRYGAKIGAWNVRLATVRPQRSCRPFLSALEWRTISKS